MRNKILLLLIGIIIPLGLFALYFALTGAPILSSTTPIPASTTRPLTDSGNKGIELESREKDGRLISSLKARVLTPRPDGRFDLQIVTIDYFIKDGRMIRLTSDAGTVTIEQPDPGSMAKAFPKDGTLSGNVTLTMGPTGSFASGSPERQANQIQTRLDEAVHFQFDTHLITSPGAIHLRGDRIAFDGRDMTLQLNNDQRRIDFLRINQGDKIKITNAAKEGFGPKPPAATQAAAAPLQPGTTAPATEPAEPPTVYRLDFGHDVLAKMGTRSLAADELNVIFETSSQSATNDQQPAQPVAGNPAAAPQGAPIAGQPPAQPASAPVTDHTGPHLPVEPITAATPDDLVITWSGPMVMKPILEGPSPLASPTDKLLEAKGSVNHPVIVKDEKDGDVVIAKAGVLTYSGSLQRVLLEPGEYQKVEVADTTRGGMTAQRIEYLQASDEIEITGPAAANVPAAILHHDAKPGAQPLLANWEKNAHITLTHIPDPKDNTKTTLAVKHATIAGKVDIRDPQFSLATDKLDVALTQAGPKNETVIERLQAMGNVNTQSFRTTPDGQALPPDFITGQILELTTAIPEGGTIPQPAKLRVDADVVARTWQAGRTDEATGKKIYSRQQIKTPLLIVDLMQKESAPRTGDATAFGGIAVKSMTAKNGVNLALEGLAKDVVVADSDSLAADAVAGTAELFGVPANNGKADQYAHIVMGENQIAGMNIQLSQKTNSIVIPGSGAFLFQQPPSKPGEKPSPVEVLWTKHMSFDGKQNLATFEGGTSAKLVGRPDQQSQLTSDTLLVKLAASAPGTPGAGPQDANGRKLQEITALGNVRASGETRDPQGALLTRMLLADADRLIYTETTRTMNVPGKGKLLVEDYRPDPAATPGARNNNANARGATAFQWGSGLTYAGDSGLITFTKDVRMVHKPTRPIQLVKGQPAPAGAAPQTIELQCQTLVATLTGDKNAPANVASPVALGNNGQVKVNKVTATTDAQLTVDQDILSADILDFDAVNNIALATGKGENWAHLLRTQQAIVEARKIQWNFTTGELLVQNPNAAIIPPTNSGLSPIPTQRP